MTARRQKASAARLVILILVLLLCIWLLYRVFLGLPPAPPPRVTSAASPARPEHLRAYLHPSHHRGAFPTSSLA